MLGLLAAPTATSASASVLMARAGPFFLLHDLRRPGSLPTDLRCSWCSVTCSHAAPRVSSASPAGAALAALVVQRQVGARVRP